MCNTCSSTHACRLNIKGSVSISYMAIVHPGMAVHFDPPSLNIHCEGVVGPRNFKLGGVIEKSYGFTFVGPVSMETLLTFEPAVFYKNSN